MPTGIYERTKPAWNKGIKTNLIPWNKGLTKETDSRVKKLAESKIGVSRSEETKRKIRETKARNPQRHSEETKKKRAESRAGYCHSEETKRKIGLANKGNVPWAKGRTFSEEHRKKIGDALRGKYVGPLAPSWRGGVSFLPYGPEFNDSLKRLIRERDKSCLYPECGTVDNLSVHHIDYDKMNNVHTNLITLCVSHNAKVNFNREHWEAYFSGRV